MNITTLGVHYFPQAFFAGRKVLIDVAGSPAQFNSATVTLGYKGVDGQFSPYLKADGSSLDITSRGGFEARVPRSGEVGISIDSAPAAGGITLDVIHAVDMPAGS